MAVVIDYAVILCVRILVPVIVQVQIVQEHADLIVLVVLVQEVVFQPIVLVVVVEHVADLTV